MIPLNFYFTFYRGSKNWLWRDIHTLCLKSCKRNTGAQSITVFYDKEDDSPEWLEAKKIPDIIWTQKDFETTINGHKLSDQRLVNDINRLDILIEKGGFYCDLDFVFLKNFTSLTSNKAVIGTQCKSKKKMNCAILGAEKGSEFIKKYREQYESFQPHHEKEFWIYANIIPWNLQHLDVCVLPTKAFYPISWSNKTFWTGKAICLKTSYAVHLWESLHPTLSVNDLLQTNLKPFVEDVINDLPVGLVHRGPACFLHFD